MRRDDRAPGAPRRRGWAGRVVVLWAVAAGCAVSEPPPAADVSGPLLPSLQVYTEGEQVNFVLQVTNTAADPIELNFRDAQMYDFIVTFGEREVWRWSGDQMFAQALRTDRVQPGDSRRYEATWRPDPALTGEYLATGVLTSSDHRLEQSTRIVLP